MARRTWASLFRSIFGATTRRITRQARRPRFVLERMEDRTTPATVGFSGGILSIHLDNNEVATFATTATNTVSITFNANLTNLGMDGSPLVITSGGGSGSITGNLTAATATTQISVTGSATPNEKVVFNAYDAPTASLVFDSAVELVDINGNVNCLSLAAATASSIGGNVVTQGIQTYSGPSTLTSAISLNSNGNNIQFGSTLAGGGNNLTLASGVGAGKTDFSGSVSNLGSGTGAALTIPAGVTGEVHFGATLGANSGLVANGASSLRFDGNVTLGNGNTGTNLAGNSLLNGVAFSGFDGLAFGGIQLATAGSSLNSNGSSILVGILAGAQNLTLASGVGIGTTTVTGAVSNLGSGVGAALSVSNGVTGLVRFQGTVTANSGLVAGATTSLRFDDQVTLGNGDTPTNLAGAVQLDGLTFSGFDGIAMNSVTLSGAAAVLNSNGGNIQLATVTGSQNLSLAAGVGSGSTTVTGPVTNLGSGTGAAFSVAPGVGGQVWFQNTVGANSGVVAASGTDLRFDGNVTLGNGDTGSTLGGILRLDGLTLNAYDGIMANSVVLSGGSVSIQATAGQIMLGTVDGAEQLTLDSGATQNSLVLGPIGSLIAPTGLTINNAATAYFYDKVTVNGGIQVNNATLNASFTGDVSANSLNSLATANDYAVTLTGSTTIVTGASVLSNTGPVLIGDSPTDIFLFGGGLDVTALKAGYSTSVAGFISSSAAAIHLDRTFLNANTTIDTTNGGTAPMGSPLSLTNGIALNGNILTTRTGLFSGTDVTGATSLSSGALVAEFGDLNLGTGVAGAAITLAGDTLIQAKAGYLTVGPLTTIAGGANDLTLQSDDLFILSPAGSITSMGSVVLAPFTVNRNLFLGAAAGTPAPGMKISQAMFNAIDAGDLVIGQSGDSGIVTVGTTSVADPVTIYANGGGGKVLVTGPLVSTAATSPGVTILGSGATTVLGANITTAGTAVVINDSVQVDANVTIDTTAGNTVPAGANIDITGGAAGIFATSGKTYGMTVKGGIAGVATLGSLKGFGNGGVGSLVTGLTATAGSIALPTANTLDGTVSLSATAISVGADLTAGAGLALTGALSLTGSSALTGDGVTVTGSINGGNNNLTLDGMSGVATSGPILVTGAITSVATLTVLDSTGATFNGAVTAQGVQVNGANTGTVAFNNNLNLAGGFTAAAGAYAVSIVGGSNTIGGPVSFGNTNPLVIGNDNTDSTTIGSGMARLTQTNLQGTVTLGGPSTLGLVNATNPGGNLAITADSLNIGYNNAGNAFGFLGITSPNAVNVTGGALTSATLTVNAGSLGESGGTLSVSGVSSLKATGAINLPGTNSFGGAVTFSGANVTLNDSTPLAISGACVASGNLTLSATGGISQAAGSISVTGSTSLSSPGASVILDKANDFASVGVTSANNVTLNDINSLVLDSITMGGALVVGVGGSLTQTNAANVGGKSTFSAPLGSSNITLGLANSFTGGVAFTGNNVLVNDAGSLTLNGPSLITGNLTATASGILMDSGGLISVGGMSNFGGSNIGLMNLNAAGPVSVTTPGGATLFNHQALTLGASSISTSLTAYTSTGNITDAGLVSVGGNAQFTTYNTDDKVLLDQSIVTGTVFFSTQGLAGDVLYGTAAPITLAGSMVQGSLTLNTGSTIGQTAFVQVYGPSSLTGSDITLNNPANLITGPVAFTGRDVSLTAGNPLLQIGPGTATGALTLAGASISQAGKLTVLGATAINASGSVSLTDTTNSLASPVTVSSGGNTILNAGNALVLGNSSIGGSFQSSSLGIDQVLGATLFVTGPSTIDVTPAADMILDNPGNDFVGSVGFNARNAILTDANAIILGPGTASGTLAVQATGIGQGGSLSVTGSSTFTSPGGDVALGDPLNAFTGDVSFIGNHVQVSDALALNIASGTATGTMDLLGAKLTQSNPVSATGATTLTATAGDIIFTLANSLGSPLSFSCSNVSLNNILPTALGAGSASGSFTLTSGGAVSQAAGALGITGPSSITATGADITLGSPANAIAGVLTFDGKNVSVSNTLDLALAGVATGNLTAAATGDISDASPVSAGGAATFSATGAGNSILVDQLSAMGLITANATDGDATIVNANAISFAGNVVGNYSLTALAGGISDGGPVSATDGLVLTAPGTSTLAQALAGPGGLTFNGTGTLTVSGANTFTGDTILNNGTMVLTGSLGGSDVLVAGGSFRGTGDMASLTATGGIVRPGQSAGSFTSADLADLGAGNTFVVEINGTTPGTGYSRVVADGVKLAGTLELTQSSPFTPMIGSKYTIVDNTGSEPVTGTFAGLPEGATLNLGSQKFVITYAGGVGANDVVLTAINTVPPPSGAVVTAPFSLAPGNLVTAVSGGFVQFSTSAGINRQFKPFPGYGGLLAVNAMDRTGAGTADSLVVAVATPGNMPRLMVIDAATGRVAQNGYAFTPEFLGGMSVSSGMANLGGINTSVLVVGAGPGANPLVRVFNSVNGSLIKQFNAFSTTYSGGVHVAMSNPDSMGASIAVVSARTGSRVSAFDLNNPSVTVANFNAFTTMMNGVSVSVGDVNDDGFNEIVVGSGSGASPMVRVYTSTGGFISQFQPFATAFTGGVNVGLTDFDADGQLEFVTAAASGTKGRLIIYKGAPVSVIHSAFMTTGISELAAATNLTIVV